VPRRDPHDRADDERAVQCIHQQDLRAQRVDVGCEAYPTSSEQLVQVSRQFVGFAPLERVTVQVTNIAITTAWTTSSAIVSSVTLAR